MKIHKFDEFISESMNTKYKFIENELRKLLFPLELDFMEDCTSDDYSEYYDQKVYLYNVYSDDWGDIEEPCSLTIGLNGKIALYVAGTAINPITNEFDERGDIIELSLDEIKNNTKTFKTNLPNMVKSLQ